MSPTLLQSVPVSARKARTALWVSTAAIVGAAALIGMTALLRGPDFVDHVTIDNRSAYDLDVAVTGAQRTGLLGLTTIGPHQGDRVEEVIDQGDTWVFVITRAGDQIARIRISRQDLAANGWRVTLPASLEETLRAKGQVPLTQRTASGRP